MTKRTLHLAGVALLTVALVGCIHGNEQPESSPSTASAVPSAVADLAPCASLLTDERLAAIVAEGRTPMDPFPLARLFPPMRVSVIEGGEACSWSSGGGGELYILITQIAVNEDAATEWTAWLEREGWEITNDPVTGVLSESEFDGPAPTSALYEDGVLYIANSPEILADLAALD